MRNLTPSGRRGTTDTNVLKIMYKLENCLPSKFLLKLKKFYNQNAS